VSDEYMMTMMMMIMTFS